MNTLKKQLLKKISIDFFSFTKTESEIKNKWKLYRNIFLKRPKTNNNEKKHNITKTFFKNDIEN